MLFQLCNRAELDGERSGELDVAPFGGDELRAVDRRAVVDGVEEVVDIQLQAQRLHRREAYDGVEDRTGIDLIDIGLVGVEAARVDRTEAQSQDGLATERSVVEGPSGDLITRNALQAIARGDVLREVARRVFGDTGVGERIAEVEVKGRRGRVIHLQLDTLTDGLTDRATDLAAVSSYTEVGADHIVQRDMVGGGVE